MNELEQIEKVAYKIRNDLDMVQKHKKFWTKGLRGACAVASHLIKQELDKIGINSDICYGQRKRWGCGHALLETENYLIDITYTQFKAGHSVVIIDKKDQVLISYYLGGFKDNKIEKQEVDFFNCWGEYQNPLICVDYIEEFFNELKACA